MLSVRTTFLSLGIRLLQVLNTRSNTSINACVMASSYKSQYDWLCARNKQKLTVIWVSEPFQITLFDHYVHKLGELYKTQHSYGIHAPGFSQLQPIPHICYELQNPIFQVHQVFSRKLIYVSVKRVNSCFPIAIAVAFYFTRGLKGKYTCLREKF